MPAAEFIRRNQLPAQNITVPVRNRFRQAARSNQTLPRIPRRAAMLLDHSNYGNIQLWEQRPYR
jgi:hypothetical protein